MKVKMAAFGPRWHFSFHSSKSEVGFNVVIAAFITKLLFIGLSLRTEAFLLVAIGFFYAWVKLVFTSKASDHVSRGTFLLISAFYVTVNVAIIYVADETLLHLLLLFTIVSGSLCGLVADRRELNDPEKGATTIWWIAITTIPAGAAFGGMVYGDTRPALGGGKPQIAQIIFTEEKKLPSEIKERLSVRAGVSMPVQIVKDVADGLVVSPPPSAGIKEFVLKIDKTFIVGTINTPPGIQLHLQ